MTARLGQSSSLFQANKGSVVRILMRCGTPFLWPGISTATHPRLQNRWGKNVLIIAETLTGVLGMRLRAGKKIQRLPPALLFSGANNIASGSELAG
jgi:hypothetical protein